jgi:uncharacterized protein
LARPAASSGTPAASSANSSSSASKEGPSSRALLATALAVLAGCGGGDGSKPGAQAVLSHGGEQTTISIEVADTPAEREQGLMGRTTLPADAGMAFVYTEDHAGSFWMKNTLIPLSIAFYAGDGRILKILDMEPCHADPCPLYDPGVAYRGALEVNQGAFAGWGISAGDRLRITSP